MRADITDINKANTGSSIRKGEAGFTLLEIIMAISILTVGLLAVASMQISAIRGNSISKDVTEATGSVQDRVEKLFAVPISDSSLNNGSHSDPDPIDDKYAITWDVQDNTPITGVKTVTVTVSWSDRGNAKSHIFEFMRTEI